MGLVVLLTWVSESDIFFFFAVVLTCQHYSLYRELLLIANSRALRSSLGDSAGGNGPGVL